MITLFVPVTVLSQSTDINESSGTLAPGATTSLSFIIKNNGPDTARYDLQVIADPTGVRPIPNASGFSIDPHSQAIYIVPVQILRYAAQGTYNVQLKFADRKTGVISTRQKELHITGLKKISLTLVSTPPYVRAGDSIQSTFLLLNEGNTDEAFQLSCTGSLHHTPTEMQLRPGQSEMIQVWQKTNADLIKNESATIQLTAATRDSTDNKWTAFCTTTVIAVHPRQQDAFRRFPVEASVAYVRQRQYDGLSGGLQAELSGKGSLGKNADGLLEFEMVTPSPIPFSSYAQYERYSASYRNRHLTLQIGDHAYSSSFLTEYDRYGRGAGLQYQFKRLTVGGFYNRPRFFQDIKDEYNLFTRITTKKQTAITVGYMYKTPGTENPSYSRNSIPGNTYLPYLTVNSVILPQKLSMEAEIAYSRSAPASGPITGTGYRLQLSNTMKRFSGSFQYLKASPDFNGYFRNADAINGYANYRLTQKLSFTVNYNQDAQNIQRDTLFLSAPDRKSYQLGLNYPYIKNGNLSIYGGNRDYKDKLTPRQFDYTEKFVRFSADQHLQPFTISMETQLASTVNRLTGLSGTSEYYTLNFGVDKKKTSLSLYGSYANTARYRENDQRIFYYGVRLQNRFSGKNHVSIFYQNNYQPEAYYKNRNLFELSYYQSTFKNQAIELSARYALQQGQLQHKDYIVAVKYSLRLPVPIQRTARYTSVSGTLHSTGGTKNSDVKVWLGNQTTITDAAGNFTFKNLIPGDYVFDIDPSSLNTGDIVARPLPATIRLTDESLTLDYAITRAARLTGSVTVQTEAAQNNSGQLSSSRNLPETEQQIIIEAISGQQSFRQLCRLGGTFEFSHLRPGSWQVNVYPTGLLKNYVLQNNQFTVDLQPDHTEDIRIPVTQKQMHIQFQQGDIKVSYDKK